LPRRPSITPSTPTRRRQSLSRSQSAASSAACCRTGTRGSSEQLLGGCNPTAFQGWLTEGWLTEGWPTEGWLTEEWLTEGWLTEGWLKVQGEQQLG